jgi:RNA polymerase sigma-70 factor, ECF subfamily
MCAVHYILPMDNSLEQRVELRDDDLIRRYQSGDVSAFGILVHRHDRKVLSIAARFTHCPEDAKDIYQEVFCRVYKGLDDFSFKSEFSTWLYRITVNVSIEHQKNQKKNKHLSLDSDKNGGAGPAYEKCDESGVESVRRWEMHQQIQAALNALSPQQKMSFILKHYEGMKIHEIAEYMNCAEGTIKNYLFNAIDRLRSQLKDRVE